MSDIPQDGTACLKCGNKGVELCQDWYCRECHVSLTFDDCVSGEWVRRARSEYFGKMVARAN